MIPAVPEVSVFRIPLDAAGETQFIQRIGYFHLWQFENSDGSISLDGAVGVVFGGNGTREDQVPMGYNSRVQYRQPVDRCTIRWLSQPGRVAVFLVGPSADAMEANNIPARQLVFQGQAPLWTVANVVVGTTAAQIVAAEPNRQRVVIQAPSANAAAVALGPVNTVSMSTGLLLEPGQAWEGRSSGAYWAIGPVAGLNVRVIREAA